MKYFFCHSIYLYLVGRGEDVTCILILHGQHTQLSWKKKKINKENSLSQSVDVEMYRMKTFVSAKGPERLFNRYCKLRP